MKPEPLQDMSGSWGAQVPIADIGEAEKLINAILVPDAIDTLSKKLKGETSVVIEIRGKVCSYHTETKGFRHYGDPCPIEHAGRQMCGIAWIWFDGNGFDDVIPDEPLYDFDGKLQPMEANIYYELARMKIELR